MLDHHHPDRYDVIIVGARAAGAATALLLARVGLRVLVVDRSHYGDDTVSTHALMRPAVVQLHRWGLLDQIVAAGTPPVRHTTFHIGHDSVPIAIKPYGGVDALYAPRRTVLDPILANAASRAGAHIRYGVTVTGISHTDGRVNGIIGRTDRGRSLEATAAIVVGADGMNSRIAHWVGAPVERAGSAPGAVAYGYWNNIDADGYHWFFRPGAAAGVIPTNHGHACVFISTTPRRFRRDLLPDPATGFLAVLADSAPELRARLDGTAAVPPLRLFPGRRAILRQPSGPGWALVGDAGYFKDPITAHGLTDALRDAELLARAITATLVDEDDPAAAFDEYHTTRNRLSDPLFTLTDSIASYTWDVPHVGVLLRQLSDAMTDEVDYLAALPMGVAV